MTETVVYMAILIILTLIGIIKKFNKLGVLLFSLYALISCIAVFATQNFYIDASRIKVLPYIFLILMYILYFFPFLKRDVLFNSKKISQESIDKKFYFFLYLYIVCTLISIINMAPSIVNLFETGSWAQNYELAVHGTESVFVYNNWFVWLATQISGYTSLLALILAFLFLREKSHNFIAIITISTYIISVFFTASYASSRGIIFQVVFRVFALYLFVYREISKKIRRIIVFLGFISAIPAVIYVIGVTVSRFSQDNAGSSIINYLGSPPITFNTGVQIITKYSFGSYMFGQLMGNIDMGPAVEAFHNGFYTFVGWIYIDWGPIGVVILGGILSLLFNWLISKRTYRVSDLLLIFYYYNTLIVGSLVIGPAQILNIVMMLLLYLIIRLFIENKVYVVGNRRF